MSKISVKYNGELRVNLTHNKSNSSIVTDAPVDNNGLGMSFSPTDLAASSLAACMITILGIHNDKKNWGIQEMNAEVEKVMSSNPRRIDKIIVELEIKAPALNGEIKDDIRNQALSCPVALSLSKEISQEVSINFT